MASQAYDIKDEYGLPKFFESDRIQVKGLIIHDLSDMCKPLEHKDTDQWLYEEKVPGSIISTQRADEKVKSAWSNDGRNYCV